MKTLTATQLKEMKNNMKIYVSEGYTITAQKPVIGKVYHNELEDVDYCATEEDTDKVLLVGTVGEPWFAPISKVLKQYSRAYGAALSENDITENPINIKRLRSYNAAIQLMEDTNVEIQAGNILHAKAGDYLVCSVDENDNGFFANDEWGYWTINEAVFKNTNQEHSRQLTDEKQFNLYKHFIKEGKQLLDQKYIEEWKKCVLYRIDDIYKGVELTASLEIIKSLNNGEDFSIVEKTFNKQGHSGLSAAICLSIVSSFCSKGKEFKAYINGYKYIFTGSKIEYRGRILNEIQAIKDFGDVKKGDLGGWIEKESNLSQSGDCWVYDDTVYVYDDAIIKDNAKIYRRAKIHGNAIIKDNAIIDCRAEIYENAIIKDNAIISDRAKIFGSAEIQDDTKIHYGAKIYENAIICGCSDIRGPIEVCGDVKLNSLIINGSMKICNK